MDSKYRNDITLLEGLSIIGDGNNPARPLKCSDSKSGAVLKLILSSARIGKQGPFQQQRSSALVIRNSLIMYKRSTRRMEANRVMHRQNDSFFIKAQYYSIFSTKPFP
ncbi:hypothetical protein V8V75_16340 [Peribacillus frigoritolerans]|uniref:hypothetical protein n=1 Tax=Peribacillus frigoritolerans TaxID=450367 RepID=UPI003008EE89